MGRGANGEAELAGETDLAAHALDRLYHCFSSKHRGEKTYASALFFAWDAGVPEEKLLAVSGMSLEKVRTLLRSEIYAEDAEMHHPRY